MDTSSTSTTALTAISIEQIDRTEHASAPITSLVSSKVSQANSQTTNAATKLFNIPELSEIILCYLPKCDILTKKGINKTWRELIKKPSIVIRAARVAQPLRIPTTVDHEEEIIGEVDSGEELANPQWWELASAGDVIRITQTDLHDTPTDVCYAASDWLHLNPILQVRAIYENKVEDYGVLHGRSLTICFEIPGEIDLSDEQMSQFLTEPLCTTIEILATPAKSWSFTEGHAYRKDGLQIRDTMAVRDDLKRAQTSLDVPNDPYWRSVSSSSTEGTNFVGVFSVILQESEVVAADAEDEQKEGQSSAAGGNKDDSTNYFAGPLPRYRWIMSSTTAQREDAAKRDGLLDAERQASPGSEWNL